MKYTKKEDQNKFSGIRFFLGLVFMLICTFCSITMFIVVLNGEAGVFEGPFFIILFLLLDYAFYYCLIKKRNYSINDKSVGKEEKGLTLKSRMLDDKLKLIEKMECEANGDPRKMAFLKKRKDNLLTKYEVNDKSDIPKISFFKKIKNNKLMESYIDGISNYSAIDPAKIPVIIEKGKSLGIEKYSSENNIRITLKRNFEIWDIDHGNIEQKETDFILSNGEKCLYRSSCCLYKFGKVIDKANYRGPRAHIKIAKGLSYNIGSYKGSVSSHMETMLEADGIINITNKRLLFKSETKTIQLNLSTIVSLDDYDGMLAISKGNVRPYIFDSEDNDKLYHTIVYARNNVTDKNPSELRYKG
jgi:hypothetical protein